MLANRLVSALVAATMLSLGGLGSSASAADLKLKAPAPPPPEPLDIHGFVDASFKNDYITPRGLLVTNTGLTTQILMGGSGVQSKRQTKSSGVQRTDSYPVTHCLHPPVTPVVGRQTPTRLQPSF